MCGTFGWLEGLTVLGVMLVIRLIVALMPEPKHPCCINRYDCGSASEDIDEFVVKLEAPKEKERKQLSAGKKVKKKKEKLKQLMAPKAKLYDSYVDEGGRKVHVYNNWEES